MLIYTYIYKPVLLIVHCFLCFPLFTCVFFLSYCVYRLMLEGRDGTDRWDTDTVDR